MSEKDDHRVEPLEWEQEFESVEIPLILDEETLAKVENLFGQHGLQHSKRIVHLGASPTGGRHGYSVVIPRSQLREAGELLKAYYQLGDAVPFSGDCPACGATVAGQMACQSCGLNLSGDASDCEENRILVEFLRTEGLL